MHVSRANRALTSRALTSRALTSRALYARLALLFRHNVLTYAITKPLTTPVTRLTGLPHTPRARLPTYLGLSPPTYPLFYLLRLSHLGISPKR